ncbi:MAG: hypothetical protein ABOK23_03840 [Candidatus Methanoperedens sp.]|nr:hypothetical protein [Candidatus Methanoperedens sp.]MCZ7394236.1 hypothetical protein [Candidatus Methanoperedens sp.]
MTTNVVQVARRKEHDALWEKVRNAKEWKKRFGTSAESAIEELRGGGFLEKLKPDALEKEQHG